ncbi:ADP-ribosyl cyclase/cyclic ADP-ribose hydrolase-like [Lineus longissimus]|uniref:ADP-ribosyl cyclase/cyclic ADP-ribose hydrolase-like n=1 Tax=Lineus longissimus TaxID=88925 RepID=UPI002B4C84A9
MERALAFLCCLGVALGAGTPKDIREVLIARCNAFQGNSAVKDAYGSSWKKRDCSKVADDFIQGFKNNNRCGVPDNAFDKVIQSAMQPMLPNKMTLWSGVHAQSKVLAKAEGLFTLEMGTLLGHMGDGLTFCGKKTPPGIDYASCPKWGECTSGGKDAVGVFWPAISKALATMARGVVRALLNGSGKCGRLPFRDESICASIELVYLNPKQVTKLEVLLVHLPGEKVVETCATGASIKSMKARVEKKGIAFSCIDDPKPIHDILCKGSPGAKGC